MIYVYGIYHWDSRLARFLDVRQAIFSEKDRTVMGSNLGESQNMTKLVPGTSERERQHDHEMKKALQRIREGADGEVGWLTRFVQTDLEALSPSEWMVLAYEVATFAATGASGAKMLPIVGQQENGWSVQVLPPTAWHWSLPSRQEAKQLQTLLRHYLQQFWEKGYARMRFYDLTLIAFGPGYLDERRGVVSVYARRPAKEFEYRAAYLLARDGWRIRRCRECQRIFLAIRRDQLYCDIRCQMRVASRKWRASQNPSPAPRKRSSMKASKGSAEGGSHGTKRR